MNERLQIGNWGEYRAVQFLENRDYNIMAKNFKCYHGEIDIIANKNDEIIFCEVKTRTNKQFGEPIDAVDNNKKRHMLNAAEYYLYKNNLLNSYVRFDVIEVIIDGNSIELNQIKNVFD